MRKTNVVLAIVLTMALQAAAGWQLYSRNKYQKSVDTSCFGKTVTALSNPAVGSFLPMYDQEVAQVVRMCSKGKDIASALQVFEVLGVYLGTRIDQAEEETIIRTSKADIKLLIAIGDKIRLSMDKKPVSTIGQVNVLLEQIENGNGKKILEALDLLKSVNYEIRDGAAATITGERLVEWIKIADVDKKKYRAIYEALLTVGLKPKQDDSALSAITELEALEGDAVGAVKSLRNSGWNCQGALDEKEVAVIAEVARKDKIDAAMAKDDSASAAADGSAAPVLETTPPGEIAPASGLPETSSSETSSPEKK